MQQIVKTITKFKSQQIKKPWKIFDNKNFKTEYIINHMKCTISNLQYVKKNETPFNIRLNSHKKDVKDLKLILAD